MSDGNFNRNLLPYNNFQSGLRAGEARMKQRALDTFARWFARYAPELSDAERREVELQFKQELER